MSRASTDPVDARLLWTRDARAYLVTSDSLATVEGSRLTFVFKNKPVATGEVTRALGDGMVIARVTSGALPREKDLGRVRILAEPAPAPRALRIAYPSSRRAALFFACDRQRLDVPFPSGSYRADTAGRVVRIVRDPTTLATSAWPETLTLQGFDEAADEEIALERGEVDVAVFWPGEISSHMRPPPAGLARMSGIMPRACVAAIEMTAESHEPRPGALIDDSLLTALNRELFRGDLEPRWHATSGGPTVRGPRYEVDPGSPGRPALERFLARAQGSREDRALVRLAYLDCAPDSVAIAETWKVDSMADARPPRAEPVFAFTCPVLAGASVVPYLRGLGPGAIVGLIACRAGR